MGEEGEGQEQRSTGRASERPLLLVRLLRGRRLCPRTALKRAVGGSWVDVEELESGSQDVGRRQRRRVLHEQSHLSTSVSFFGFLLLIGRL